ncbi:MAG TPA: LD-carboxypeptidase [Methylibium sp.]
MTKKKKTEPEAQPPRLILFSPAGVVAQPVAVRRAAKRLAAHGYAVSIDEAALVRQQRFAGDDDTRLAALHRIAKEGAQGRCSIAMATRGGYGLTRLLDRIDWKLMAKSVAGGLRWVGYSDMTALQLAALTHGAGGDERAPHGHGVQGDWWAGPLAIDDFGRTQEQGGVDDVTEACFLEAMHGELEAVGFRTDNGFDGLDVSGRLWGGNLCVLASLLGTPHFPKPKQVRGGILFLEDVNEHPYRVERSLLQLHQAGVLDAQKAVLLGAFTDWRKSPLDRGYTLKTAIAHLRSVTTTPILTGLPLGHIRTHVSLPHGRRATLAVQGRDAFLGW